ncbi:MAG: helix-turn-helix transcriptional regulator [Pseudomonadota bacterium]|nr:helix-turn-helix transcriptional regulator [Pseudomonadota bacterium]
MSEMICEATAEISVKLNSEIRRGSLVLAVLGQLKAEHYGYSLRKSLAEQGLEVEEGTLYPLIRRLEKQGLLQSEWREENKRRKRFYRLSQTGGEVYKKLLQEWLTMQKCLLAITADRQPTAQNQVQE